MHQNSLTLDDTEASAANDLFSSDQKQKKRVQKQAQKEVRPRLKTYKALARESSRQENGLVELTRKFIKMIKKAEGQCIDLNIAVLAL